MSGASGLREAMQFLLGRDAGAWPSDFRGVKPTSLRELLAACQDPRFADWLNPSRDPVEDTSFSEEAQGIATDGDYWFVSNNAGDRREALRRLTWGFDVRATVHSPFDPDKTHIGALGVRNGWVYVAVQGPDGIWKVSTDFSQSTFLKYEKLPDDDNDMFSWCDLNPHNGLLYTCAFETPTRLRAYRESDDPNTFNPHAMDTFRIDDSGSAPIPVAESRLVPVSTADIPLIQPTDYRPTTRVQGGCFTPHHKWLAVCDDAGFTDVFNPTTWWVERIHCHSTISGAFLGRRLLPANTDESGSILPTSTRNELEAICVAPLTSTSGRPIQVHVLELNNEELSTDDFYLWHFSVPDPEAL
jgi:hypothetical protein